MTPRARTTVGNVLRVGTLLAAVLAAAGSATSSSNDTKPNDFPQQQAQNTPPPPQQMEPARALGLWRSTFGAVKIEADNSKGGLTTGSVQGIWVYQRQGQEVIGYFSGSLRGNVLDFRWQEPNNPPLTGAGYLVFDPQGRQYAGRWWSDHRDRIGDWNGWRQAAAGQQQPDPYNQQQPSPYGQQQQDPYGGQYGGQAYGYPQQGQQPTNYPVAPQQRYPQQPAPYGQPQQQPRYPQQPSPYAPQPPQQPSPYGPPPQQRYPQPTQYPQQPQQQPQQPPQAPPPSPYGY